MTPRTNVLTRWAVDFAKYIGWVADDNRFETEGWDREVIAALSKTPMVFCNDVVSPGSKPSHVFIDSRVVRSLGWLVHPDLKSTFFDDVWANLGVGPIDITWGLDTVKPSGGLGIDYLPSVEISHLYREKDNVSDYLRDEETYQTWLRHDCEDDIRRARRALREPATAAGR